MIKNKKLKKMGKIQELGGLGEETDPDASKRGTGNETQKKRFSTREKKPTSFDDLGYYERESRSTKSYRQ